MENPFEILMQRLDNIERLLYEIKQQKEATNTVAKEIMNLSELAEYLGLTKATIYNMTSTRKIPHFKKSKKIYFKTSEINEWMSKGKIKTDDEISEETHLYFKRRNRK
jgi:excisionase family DNA binding protein